MSQKTISAYYTKVPKSPATGPLKRSVSDIENTDSLNVSPDEKRSKHDEGPLTKQMDSGENNSRNPALQETKEEVKNEIDNDQGKKIEINRLTAQLKLRCKSLAVLHSNIGLSWFNVLNSEFDKPYFKKLSRFVSDERARQTPVFPRPEQVWTWTRECEVDQVKAVILGQDPYHNPGQAHGLSFSVPVGVPPPPSLLNMYKELEKDIEGFKRPGHGYLIGWARQGVLLLNAVLTVRCRSPNSHKDQGWEQLTDAVIKHLNSHGQGIVFFLWGSYAQKKAEFLDQKKHHVLKTVHPSPLSASRGFFGCKHFSRCNELLTAQGKTPIDWAHLPTE